MTRKMKDSGIEWIGMIPENWQIIKSKYFILSNDGGVWGNEPHDDDSDKIVIRSTEQTVDGKWIIEEPAKRDLSGVKYENCRILKDDLLMTKSSGSSLHIGKTTLADDYFEENECYYSNFIQRIRVKNINPRLMWYIFNSNLAREQFVYLQNSTSGIGNINAENISNIFVAVGSDEEQQKIVSFLDSKVGDIDAIISNSEETIEEYKRYKNALVAEIITKGLDKTVSMKDSGIEWVGQVPSHWKVHVLSQIFTQLKNKNSDLSETNLLSLSYGKIKRKDINSSDGLLPESFDGYNVIDKNDIVLRLTDLQNDHKSLRVGHVKERGIITSAYVTLRCKEDIETDYYYYFLHTFDIFKGFYGMGAGVRQGLNYEGIRSMKILSPDIKEQQEIVEYLNVKCAEIDALIAKKEAFVEEMEAYKKSLIYEYVTGKKEVL